MQRGKRLATTIIQRLVATQLSGTKKAYCTTLRLTFSFRYILYRQALAGGCKGGLHDNKQSVLMGGNRRGRSYFGEQLLRCSPYTSKTVQNFSHLI